MRDIQRQSIQRSVLPAVLEQHGGSEYLLSNSGKRSEALRHAESIAEVALSVGLVLSDINGLTEKTYETIMELIESRKEVKPQK
jgi:hypothetical protein